MLLAGRYGGQKHMIGAPIFPIYKKVLTAALGMALLVHAGMSIALAAAGKPFGESLAMLFHYPGVALKVFGWVTFSDEPYCVSQQIDGGCDHRQHPAQSASVRALGFLQTHCRLMP
jgi:hypothetical protein